jgi:imidazole glycerol phosphate synthase subunit HisF
VCVEGGADAVAMADVLHNRRVDLRDIREQIRDRGIDVREAAPLRSSSQTISA